MITGSSSGEGGWRKASLKKVTFMILLNEKETTLGSSGERTGKGSSSKCKGLEVRMNVKKQKMACGLKIVGKWHKAEVRETGSRPHSIAGHGRSQYAIQSVRGSH